MELSKFFNVDDFIEPAREQMEEGAFEYYVGGSGLEITLSENVTAFRRYRFRPRVLRGVSSVDMTTTLLGSEVSMPICLAPAALQRLAHPDGEVAVARAAQAAGTLQVLSTESSFSLEDVAAASGGPKWFQLYVNEDRALSKELAQRAEAAGYRAIVLTVDLATPGYREREYRQNFTPPPEVGPGSYETDHSIPMTDRIGGQYSESLTWDEVASIKSWTSLPLVMKGIITAEDAVLAIEHGADSIVVSNHGARQLDQTIASIDALSEVVEAVEGAVEIYVDGGVRRGTDALIALSLGARGVFVGRPYLWGLGAAGESGVAGVLEILRDQLENGMLNLGVANLSEIAREHLV